ncbi:TonB-dependent siderophore receptor [Zavarzinia compransoris]|uniref:TonB-dependent siderophore receptor n=1 Tax=Zavarzinia compransoris TaxID=1264899 RepID=A0A317DT45_9PROT|nr:TonB-dependent siderophore receptor [Zavarzinia compransoris]PWR17839.1 TonB-dependent siderophore receptor [Zavarzinia compransoris]TDP49374.1 ferric enterobactin receptor [Zavarzinia compransoris]
MRSHAFARGCQTAIYLSLALMPAVALGQQATPAEETAAEELPTVVVTAEQELKQAPGVSVITEQDLKERPATNDLMDIIRTMPGVNLSGNSSSGQYGNNRQIDLRGMGPENTLILIDGKPVTSRNSIRMGRSGERNTRGDSNWVPADQVERIEVIRGPAAARYGSGAAGGVINIITKKITNELSGSATAYVNVPEHGEEGDSRRLNFNLSGPVVQDALSFRIYGGYNRTDADDLDLNGDYLATGGVTPPAGREGVENWDINALARWALDAQQTLDFEAAYSRQGNIYAGDRAVSGTGTDLLTSLANDGAETNRMLRRTFAVTHKGEWGWAWSNAYVQWENTRNTRLNEGLAGGPEGSINTATVTSTSTLDNYTAHGEINIPFEVLAPQTLTAGAEWSTQKLDDPFSVSQTVGAATGSIGGISASGRSGEAEQDNFALFLEDNIEVMPGVMVTPGLRFDHNSNFGSNVSPSLNLSVEVADGIFVKGGIARAFKAPNLYQANPNYLYYTMGMGCPVDYPNLGGGCYILGNADLDPEVSVNKEIGLSFDRNGWNASLTYFHNDYENKIVAGDVPVGNTTGGTSTGRVFKWDNAPEALVEGLEGNILVPVTQDISWNTNFTYMLKNHNKEDGQPLSVIPEYTINSTLKWRPTEALVLTGSVTYYGEQEPRTIQTSGAASTGDQLRTRDPYAIFGLSGTYDVTDYASVTAGVSNLLDERLFREANSNGEGANTYNEPGRAFYLSITTSF